MKETNVKALPAQKWLPILSIVVGVTLCVFGLTSSAQNEAASGSITQANGNSAARQAIQEKGQAAVEKVQTTWQRIDEKRLKNRSRDEIVAWIIMGMLAGGLLYRFGRCSQISSIFLGLVGAFIGGIIAHVAQLDLGLGPVLITYEDLLCTLAGAVLLVSGARWSTLGKLFKPRVP